MKSWQGYLNSVCSRVSKKEKNAHFALMGTEAVSDLCLASSGVYDQGWIWACEQIRNWARPLVWWSPQLPNTIAPGVSNKLLWLLCALVTCLVDGCRPFTSQFSLVQRLNLRCVFSLKCQENRCNCSRWLDNWLDILHQGATFCWRVMGTTEFAIVNCVSNAGSTYLCAASS